MSIEVSRAYIVCIAEGAAGEPESGADSPTQSLWGATGRVSVNVVDKDHRLTPVTVEHLLGVLRWAGPGPPPGWRDNRDKFVQVDPSPQTTMAQDIAAQIEAGVEPPFSGR